MQAHLRSLLLGHDWDKVTAHLDTLSAAQFRMATNILGETLMKELPDDDFWALSEVLIRYNSKAFLKTLLKSTVGRGPFVDCKGFIMLCGLIKSNTIEVRKTLDFLLPTLNTPQEVLSLFVRLDVNDPEKRIVYLLRTQTLPASYVLLLTLKQMDHNKELLLRTVRYLMKKEDDRWFNLASLFKTYFGLDGVKGSFARKIEPYQLARLDSSYEAFCKALNR